MILICGYDCRFVLRGDVGSGHGSGNFPNLFDLLTMTIVYQAVHIFSKLVSLVFFGCFVVVVVSMVLQYTFWWFLGCILGLLVINFDVKVINLP